jgi:cytochrome P450
LFSSQELFGAGPDDARRRAVQELAAQGPIHRIHLPGGQPAWFVTGYPEARIALSDARLLKNPAFMPYADRLPAESAALHHHMLNANPPDHARLRKLVSAAFTRRRVDELAPRVDAIGTELLDPIAEKLRGGATVDLMDEFAFPLPFRVICALLGIPRQDEEAAQKVFGTLGAGSLVPFDEFAAASAAMIAFIGDLLEDKRRQPGDDLLSALLQVRDGDDRLSEGELTSMVSLLVTAGHETTTGLIANGVLALLRHPGQLALLRAEPDRLPAAVEEILRYDGSVQTAFPVYAGERFELGSATIEAGDLLVVSVLAANLDPAVNGPDRFDITRAGTHLAFGHGIHHCLGAPLARLEARIALAMLFDRLPGIALAPQTEVSADRIPSMVFNRPDHVWLRQPESSR